MNIFKVHFHKWNYSYEFQVYLISKWNMGQPVFRGNKINYENIKIYRYNHKSMFKKYKKRNIFQKQGYKSYFYMKPWMVIDFNTNYQIPLILTTKMVKTLNINVCLLVTTLYVGIMSTQK